jgi:hypothetical protein
MKRLLLFNDVFGQVLSLPLTARTSNRLPGRNDRHARFLTDPHTALLQLLVIQANEAMILREGPVLRKLL